MPFPPVRCQVHPDSRRASAVSVELSIDPARSGRRMAHMTGLVVQLLIASLWGFFVITAVVPFLPFIVMVGAYITWWWQDRRDIRSWWERQADALVEEIED